MDALLSHQHDPTADAGACSATASSCLAVTSSNVPIITALLAGASLHLLLRPVHEIDQQALRLVAASTVAPATCFAALHWMRGLDVAAALWDTTVLTSSFAFGLLGSMLIYRAFFHRLCRFPGPFAARLSRFYALGHAAATKKSHRKLERLHEQYGDFVRTGPRELAIFRASAVPAIYGPASKCYRSGTYDNPSTDAGKSSIVGTRDVVAHRRRKKAWDRGLGFRALDVYEPRVKSKVDLFLSRLALGESSPIDVTELCTFFGFDVMAEIGFSKDFHMLETGRSHPAVDGVREQVVYIAVLGMMPWLFISLVNIMDMLNTLGVKSGFQEFLDWCSAELAARRKAIKAEKQSGVEKDPQDVISWLIKADDEGDGSAPPGERAFQEDSRVLVVAGSDTTSAALANSLYFLTKHPEVYQKLQALLDAEFPRGEQDWSYARLKNIPYLDHVIHETLRLKPSVPSGLPRLTPPGGLLIDGVHVPADTIVSVPAHTIHRDPRAWGDRPAEFVPERWADELLTPERAPFVAFTRGQYACPGKNLALMELRMVVSLVVMRYERMEFAVPEDVVRFDEDALDTFTMSLPPLPLVLTRR